MILQDLPGGRGGTLRGRGSLMVTYPNCCCPPPVWCFRRREGVDEPSLFPSFSKFCSVTTFLRFVHLDVTADFDFSSFSSFYGNSSSVVSLIISTIIFIHHLSRTRDHNSKRTNARTNEISKGETKYNTYYSLIHT